MLAANELTSVWGNLEADLSRLQSRQLWLSMLHDLVDCHGWNFKFGLRESNPHLQVEQLQDLGQPSTLPTTLSRVADTSCGDLVQGLQLQPVLI